MIYDHPEVIKTLEGGLEIDALECEFYGVNGTDYAKEEFFKKIGKAMEDEGAIEIEVIDHGSTKFVKGKITYVDHKLVKELTEKEGGAK